MVVKVKKSKRKKVDKMLTELDTQPHLRFKGKKRAMIKALVGRLGVVKYACEDVGISRETHYTWLRKDPKYKKAFELLDEDVKDVIESAFLGLVLDKNPQVVLKGLTTKCKDRGYGEKQEVQLSGPSGSDGLTVNVVTMDKEEYDERNKRNRDLQS